MPNKVTDDEFIAAWRKLGGAKEVSEHLNISERSTHKRRRSIEERLNMVLVAERDGCGKLKITMPENKQRATMHLPNGTILVGSDCHYMPGEPSTAHLAFIEAIKLVKPDVICLNGDVAEFGTISRHPALDLTPKPSLKDELHIVRDRVGEIERVAGNAVLHHTWGNHDLRLQVRLANQSPEFAGLIDLDMFMPGWLHSMSLLVNNNTMILHKWAQGVHASFNNVVKGGLSIITGHTHRLNCRPFTDYRGTRYGIETGSMADFDNDCFNYTQETPKSWENGFVLLTFKDGELLYPEFCQVKNGHAFFRGQNILGVRNGQ